MWPECITISYFVFQPQVPSNSLTTTTHFGCQVDGAHYTDGMQIQRDEKRPCELCYCIRNYTVCVVQVPMLSTFVNPFVVISYT